VQFYKPAGNQLPHFGVRLPAITSGERQSKQGTVQLGNPCSASGSLTIDTEDSFRGALQSLIDHKLLPPAAK
jgi:hypothetical protein